MPQNSPFPLSIADACEHADWYARYALDRISSERRLLHPGVRSHLTAGLVQLATTLALLDPANDRKAPV